MAAAVAGLVAGLLTRSHAFIAAMLGVIPVFNAVAIAETYW